MSQRMPILLALVLVSASVSAKSLVDGDASAGASKAAACAACHGKDGNSQNPQWPKLAGQNATYIYKQLQLFKSGKRKNAIMQGQAAGLSDTDMKNLAVYFSQQQTKPGVADPKLAKQGALLYRAGRPKDDIPACSGCHGPSGLGNPAARYPRLSGQHATYVAAQLKAYRDGERAQEGRLAGIMTGVAKDLSDDDIQALASYVSGLRPRSAP